MAILRCFGHSRSGGRWASATVAVAATLALIGWQPASAAPAAKPAPAHGVKRADSSSRAYYTSQINTALPEVSGRWGERLASAALPGPHGGAPLPGAAGDINGDGVNDYFVAEPSYNVPATPTSPALPKAGRVYAVSGKTKKVVYTIDSPSPQADAVFGFVISVVGDVNGDGTNDIAIGTNSQTVNVNGVNEVNQGEAWVFSGHDGHLLYALNDPDPGRGARFGSRLGQVSDANGDGIHDIIVGAPGSDVCAPSAGPTPCSTATAATPGVACGSMTPIPAGCRTGQGEAFIFSGADGSYIRTLSLPDTDQPIGTCSKDCGDFGLAVQGAGDVKVGGSPVPTVLVDAANYNYDTSTSGGPGAAGGACQVPATSACNQGQGRMYLFNATDGTLIARIDDPTPQANAFFGFQDAAPLSPGDVNNDGSNDLYGEGFLQDGPLGAGQGEAWVFDGQATANAGHGVVLYPVNSPQPEAGGQFGFSMTTTDYNGTGQADVYVGSSPHHVVGALGSGVTAVFAGQDGSVLKTLPLPQGDIQPSTAEDLGPNIGWSVAAPGDLDGDGRPDYLAGAPFLDVGAHKDQGGVFAFQSGKQPYTMAASDGGIFNFGSAGYFESTGGVVLNKPIVAAVNTPDGQGYWLVASDGGVFNFGDAGFFGSLGGVPLNAPIVGMAPTVDGGGYWLVAADGGVFSFGDAPFDGSLGGAPINQPVVGMAATADGGGYWLVAADGGVFTFGDTGFFGSTGGVVLNKAIVGMAPSADARGYWLVASDGGIFTFGDAAFYGSTGGTPLNKPVVGMAATSDGGGYWLAASDGGIFNFGDATFQGSTGGVPLNQPVVAITSRP